MGPRSGDRTSSHLWTRALIAGVIVPGQIEKATDRFMGLERRVGQLVALPSSPVRTPRLSTHGQLAFPDVCCIWMPRLAVTTAEQLAEGLDQGSSAPPCEGLERCDAGEELSSEVIAACQTSQPDGKRNQTTLHLACQNGGDGGRGGARLDGGGLCCRLSFMLNACCCCVLPRRHCARAGRLYLTHSTQDH